MEHNFLKYHDAKEFLNDTGYSAEQGLKVVTKAIEKIEKKLKLLDK